MGHVTWKPLKPPSEPSLHSARASSSHSGRVFQEEYTLVSAMYGAAIDVELNNDEKLTLLQKYRDELLTMSWDEYQKSQMGTLTSLSSVHLQPRCSRTFPTMSWKTGRPIQEHRRRKAFRIVKLVARPRFNCTSMVYLRYLYAEIRCRYCDVIWGREKRRNILNLFA